MPDLKYTGKLGNIQGKPRVYFSCHPRDFVPYFGELSREILRIINCAIFYYEPDEDVPLDDDYYLDLGQMQLFVIPVTGHLLRERSRAMDVELRFAMELHIPVLPIMLEDGLTEAFGQRFGDLQFLNRVSQDDSELPYEEKLAGRLRSVLVGDELAAKIRAAFDACIFLSYRKKDRVYAQQLMRLIHQNEFCRDIAIWYDEFLSPGEDFNNAIADALKKSDLFALAVTPNVVNEVNYIMTTEYPMARKENKPILPVELVPTDRGMLREKYEGCPDCTNAYDGQALSAAIAAKLRGFALRENGGDPRHDFLIGLAYLNGIDVELDRKRALELITGAAEAGLIEALQKIRDMYLYGEHVSPSYSMAAHWTQALAVRLEERYREAPTEANGDLLAKAYWDLGDYLDESGKRKEAELAYEKMQDVGKALVRQWNSAETRRMLAVCLIKLGTAARDRGDRAKARGLFQQGLEHFQQLYDTLGTPRAAWDLAVTSGRMGSLLSGENPQAALDCFMLAMRLLQKADSDTDSDRVKLRVARNRANLCNAIGDLYCLTGHPKEAMDYVRQSIRITGQIRSEDHGILSVNSWRDLAQSHAIAGNILFAEKQWDEAERHYLESTEIDRWLYDEFHAYQEAGALHASYCQLEQIYMAKSDWARAEKICRSRLALIPELWDRESPEGKTELVNAYGRLGRICMEAGRFDDALRHTLAALEHNRELYRMVGTEGAADGITALYGNIGNIYVLIRRDDAAEEYYLKALAQAEYVFETFRTMRAGLTLADRHYTLGALYHRAGRHRPALDQYNAGLDLCERMYHDTQDLVIMRHMTGAFQAMGNIYREAGLTEDAKACYDWVVTGASILWRQSGSPADLDCAAAACYSLGTVSQGGARETNLKNAAGYWTMLSKQFPDRPDYAAKARQALRLLEQ